MNKTIQKSPSWLSSSYPPCGSRPLVQIFGWWLSFCYSVNRAPLYPSPVIIRCSYDLHSHTQRPLPRPSHSTVTVNMPPITSKTCHIYNPRCRQIADQTTAIRATSLRLLVSSGNGKNTFENISWMHKAQTNKLVLLLIGPQAKMLKINCRWTVIPLNRYYWIKHHHCAV